MQDAAAATGVKNASLCDVAAVSNDVRVTSLGQWMSPKANT